MNNLLTKVNEKREDLVLDTESSSKSLIQTTITRQDSYKRVLPDNFKFDVEQDLREIRF
jgi:hypothetical protein